jgi:hypothetical protein
MKKNKSNVGKVIAISAGVAALAAAGYFFFGPNGEKNRKKMKGWMIKMKGEIVEKMEKVKHVTEPLYHSIVDSVAKKYSATVDKKELASIVKELKTHWNSISGKKPTVKKTVKKAVSKKKK